jgi:hypothetical protein
MSDKTKKAISDRLEAKRKLLEPVKRTKKPEPEPEIDGAKG